MGSTRPMWVGLDLCDGFGWIKFFLTHHGGFGQKIPSTRLMNTPTYSDLVNMDYLSHYLCGFAQVFYKDNPR